jgi:hypothetical protein
MLVSRKSLRGGSGFPAPERWARRRGVNRTRRSMSHRALLCTTGCSGHTALLLSPACRRDERRAGLLLVPRCSNEPRGRAVRRRLPLRRNGRVHLRSGASQFRFRRGGACSPRRPVSQLLRRGQRDVVVAGIDMRAVKRPEPIWLERNVHVRFGRRLIERPIGVHPSTTTYQRVDDAFAI